MRLILLSQTVIEWFTWKDTYELPLYGDEYDTDNISAWDERRTNSLDPLCTIINSHILTKQTLPGVNICLAGTVQVKTVWASEW